MFHLDSLPTDIIKEIQNELDFIAQSNLRLVSTYFVTNPITNLSVDISNRARLKISGNDPSRNDLLNLTDAILKLYPSITKLNIAHNEKVTDIKHLVNLQILNASGYSCRINNDTIMGLTNLTKLNTHNNSRITNVNHLKKLRILNAIYNSGIDDTGISSLTNLTKLNIYDNDRITHISHLTNLWTLNIGRGCRVNNNEIMSLTNLTKLNLNKNRTITNIGCLTNLRILNIGNSINSENIIIQMMNDRVNDEIQKSIRLLPNLTKLNGKPVLKKRIY